MSKGREPVDSGIGSIVTASEKVALAHITGGQQKKSRWWNDSGSRVTEEQQEQRADVLAAAVVRHS